MELKRRLDFYTKVYGSQPAKGAQDVLSRYIEDKIDAELLSFADKNKKQAQEIDEMVVNILSIFHRNGSVEPVHGNWMLRKCILNTGLAIFNALKDKTHPSKQMIPLAITLVEPLYIPYMRDGKPLKHPDGVDTYAVTIPTKPGQKGRSFFCAYEYFAPPVYLECTFHFDDDLITPELADFWVNKSGLVGTGAFRERFGHFNIGLPN